MKNTPHIIFLSALAAITPRFASAQAPTDFRGFIMLFIELISMAIPIVGMLTLLVFFWGIAMFIRSADSDKGREQGKNLIFWGVIGLFVVVTFWGIIAFLKAEFGFGGGLAVPLLPTG